MGSFALYSKFRDTQKPEKCDKELSADIHFNLWNISATSQSFLDVGIMISNLPIQQPIFLYVPFCVEQDEITDLGALLSTDKRLLAAVFNENYSLLQSDKPKWADIQKGNKTQFSIFSLDIGNNLIATKMTTGGTKIQITIPAASRENQYPCERIYVRFRINSPGIQNNLIRKYTNSLSSLIGMLKEYYVVDFRYNDTRSFNDQELEEFTTDKKDFIKTKKLHFLLLCKAFIDVECGSNVKKREIEKGVWDNYVKCAGIHDTNDIIAYHASGKINLNNESDIGPWEFFAKQSIDVFGKHKMALLGLGTIGIGLLINFLYDLVKNGAIFLFSLICNLF